MKPSIFTPSTLSLGIYVAGDDAAITGALRRRGRVEVVEGDTWEVTSVEHDVVALVGKLWATLAKALAEAQVIGVKNVALLTNDDALVRLVGRPVRAPKPDKTKRHYFARDDYIDVGYGGDADHWQVLRQLAMVRYSITKVDKLDRAKELLLELQGR